MIVGAGKRLFAETTGKKRLRLVETKTVDDGTTSSSTRRLRDEARRHLPGRPAARSAGGVRRRGRSPPVWTSSRQEASTLSTMGRPSPGGRNRGSSSAVDWCPLQGSRGDRWSLQSTRGTRRAAAVAERRNRSQPGRTHRFCQKIAPAEPCAVTERTFAETTERATCYPLVVIFDSMRSRRASSSVIACRVSTSASRIVLALRSSCARSTACSFALPR